MSPAAAHPRASVRQVRGHNIAELDPLGMYDADLDGSTPPDLELANYGFTEADLDKEFSLGGALSAGFLGAERAPMKLRDIVGRLNQVPRASSIDLDRPIGLSACQ